MHGGKEAKPADCSAVPHEVFAGVPDRSKKCSTRAIITWLLGPGAAQWHPSAPHSVTLLTPGRQRVSASKTWLCLNISIVDLPESSVSLLRAAIVYVPAGRNGVTMRLQRYKSCLGGHSPYSKAPLLLDCYSLQCLSWSEFDIHGCKCALAAEGSLLNCSAGMLAAALHGAAEPFRSACSYEPACNFACNLLLLPLLPVLAQALPSLPYPDRQAWSHH